MATLLSLKMNGTASNTTSITRLIPLTPTMMSYTNCSPPLLSTLGGEKTSSQTSIDIQILLLGVSIQEIYWVTLKDKCWKKPTNNIPFLNLFRGVPKPALAETCMPSSQQLLQPTDAVATHLLETKANWLNKMETEKPISLKVANIFSPELTEVP
jgi:hypothetical protein